MNHNNVGYIGALVGVATGTSFSNVHLKGDIYLRANSNVGGLIGVLEPDTNSVLSDLSVEGDGFIWATKTAGGIIGSVNYSYDGAATLELNNIKVSEVVVHAQTMFIGGVVGELATSSSSKTIAVTIDGVQLDGVRVQPYNISSDNAKKTVGAVVGGYEKEVTSVTIKNVTGTAIVENAPDRPNDAHATMLNGGIIGKNTGNEEDSHVTIEGCEGLTVYWYSTLGVRSDGYVIKDVEGLIAFRDLVNGGEDCTGKTVVLAADIDLSSVDNWEPIGTVTNAFKGTFDGGNKTISNLTINTTTGYAGLFGNAENVVLKNVAINGATVTVHNDSAVTYYIGILIARCLNDNSSISNVKVYNAKVQGTTAQYVGAVAGWMAGPISDCYAELTVTASTNGSHGQVGGIVGQAYGDISRCYAKVDLSGSSIGGIVGYFHCKNTNVGTPAITISNCYATGKINASMYGEKCPTYSGGIIACTYSKNIRIVNNFFDGTISEYANPFVGASTGDDGAELEELTLDVFENNSWSENLSASQHVQGYQGKIQIESLERDEACSFTAGMTYEDFLAKLAELNG